MSTPEPHMGIVFERILEEDRIARLGDRVDHIFWAWRDAKRSTEAMYDLYYRRALRWFGPSRLPDPVRPHAATSPSLATHEVLTFIMEIGHHNGRSLQRVTCEGYTVEEVVDGGRSKSIDDLINDAKAHLQRKKPKPANDG